ncbi:hypothetical protein GGTG_05398 [Gaeumannomyces tritici R3-111a-1]|uniref:Uncharacterized protein n=1 Tax=Gaeumannomyces tritici (strain R3-111a-1) TaxID=644352 RepID=J3NVT6_GAET3|nr:hypothetical protein GGTG_05398 [Gaeumannomyces tritici R3-111a-1]EJT75465.1 hypothetical protein GGTG_05398 [Gaeumannomyces tritici R3-111a-1]
MPPPSLHLWRRDESPAGDQGASHPGTAWIIAPIISATILISLAVVCVVRHILNQRRKRRQQTPTTEKPCSPHINFRRNRKSSQFGSMDGEEEQRAMIIRKSLAERSSRSSEHSRRHESMSSLASMLAPSANDKSGDESDSDGEGDLPASDDRRASGGLRDDWKEFEARVQRERSYSGEIHPAVHPALARPPPYRDLSIPERTVTRSRSSSQCSLPTQDLPPLLPHVVAGVRVNEQGRENAGSRGAGRGRPRSEIPDITVHRVG